MPLGRKLPAVDLGDPKHPIQPKQKLHNARSQAEITVFSVNSVDGCLEFDLRLIGE
ncbi:MAG: hypothetical protein JWM11_5693 [Planctomycetaceae bacterium]|nr:hypothetical protein [Planctomycetaceae bacterium]